MRPAASICVFFVAAVAAASERAEVARLAPKYQAEVEVRLEDGTFCDLVNEEYAIEVDYPRKWAEAVGQSLHYALLLNKKPAIILLLRDPNTEWRHLVRCAQLCGKYDIRLYVEPVTVAKTSATEVTCAYFLRD